MMPSPRPTLAMIGPGGTPSALRQQWVGIVANANAGVGHGRHRVSRLVNALRNYGLHTRISWTGKERSDMVQEAGRDWNCRCLVAVGGDGTVAALLNERPSAPITVLPSGTENLFAAQFGITADPERLAGTIAGGRVVWIDLGEVDNTRFSLMAGVGFDADVISRHHLSRLNKSGGIQTTHRFSYIKSILGSSFQYGFPPIRARITDSAENNHHEEILEGAMVFAFNLPRYALGLPVAPSALGHDGFLDLVVFAKPGPLEMLRYLWLVYRGIHLDLPDVTHRKVKSVTIWCEGDDNVPVQLDGDPAGNANAANPRTIRIRPHATQVLVPTTFRTRDDDALLAQ